MEPFHPGWGRKISNDLHSADFNNSKSCENEAIICDVLRGDEITQVFERHDIETPNVVMEHENVHGALNIASNNDLNNEGHPGTPIVANGSPHGSDDEGDDKKSDANETPTLIKMNDDGMGDGDGDDEDFDDPGEKSASGAIPETIPTYPSFIDRISNRFHQIQG